MKIKNFNICSDRTFVIAEVGNNHNGSIENAFTLVDHALDAGADCVKFQMRLLFILYLLLASISNANATDLRANTIFKNLRCLVCEGQSVYESNSDFARDIKNYVKKEIINNRTDKEIYDFLISKYGKSVIFNPKFSIRNIMLWFAPASFFLIGVYVIFRRSGAKK